jgi:glycosyltransferase involved in cell wall biosynthesis
MHERKDMINLFLIDYHLLSQNNGLGSYMSALVNGLVQHDHIAIHIVYLKCSSVDNITKVDDQGLTCYFIPFDVGGNTDPAGTHVALASYLAEEMKGLSNIVIHFNWVSHCSFSYSIKQQVDCVTILTKHCIPWRDLITTNYPLFLLLERNLKTSKSKAPLEHPSLSREALAYNGVDHIICVTAIARYTLKRMFGIDDQKTSLIRNGIDVSQIPKTPIKKKDIIRRKYGIGAHEKIILFAGKITQAKGVSDLGRAVEKIIGNRPDLDVRLLMVGDGNYSLVLQSFKRNWPAVSFTGVREKAVVYELYQAADVGVVPSYIEQCSYTAIEMMHHGLPIIVADVDGLAEMVPDGCGLRVPLRTGKTKAHLDAVKLKESILFILENEPIARQYAARAKQFALDHFNALKMAGETLQVYEKLISLGNIP